MIENQNKDFIVSVENLAIERRIMRKGKVLVLTINYTEKAHEVAISKR